MSQYTDGLPASQQAKTAQGSKFYFAEVGQSDPETATWTLVEGMKAVNFPIPDKPEIDVTTTASTNREFIPAMGTIPDWTTSLDFYPNNSVHIRIMEDIAPSNDNRLWKVENPFFTIVVYAYIKGWPVTGNIDTQFTADMTLKVSGEPTIKRKVAGGSIAWVSTLLGDSADGAVAGTLIATLTPFEGATTMFTESVTGNFVANNHYSLSNVPDGLTGVIARTSATTAQLTFTGTATAKVDVSNVILSFKDSAFDNGSAVNVTDSTKSDIAITFA